MTPYADTILKDATQIKALDHLITTPEFLQSNLTKHLRQFSTDQTFNEIIPYISSFSRLSSLHFSGYGDTKDIQFETMVQEAGDEGLGGIAPNPPLAPSSLTHLDIRYPDSLGWRFLTQAAGQLKYLNISLHWKWLFGFIAMSEDMERLESLQICFSFSPDDAISPHSLPSLSDLRIPKTNLKRLNLALWSVGDFGKYGDWV